MWRAGWQNAEVCSCDGFRSPPRRLRSCLVALAPEAKRGASMSASEHTSLARHMQSRPSHRGDKKELE